MYNTAFTASIYLKLCSNTWHAVHLLNVLPVSLEHIFQGDITQGGNLGSPMDECVSFSCWTWSPRARRLSSGVKIISTSSELLQFWSATLLLLNIETLVSLRLHGAGDMHSLRYHQHWYENIKTMWRRSLPFQLNLPSACLPRFVSRSIPWKHASRNMVRGCNWIRDGTNTI